MKLTWKILLPVLVVALLAGAFWYGGDSPDSQGWTIGTNDTSLSESDMLTQVEDPEIEEPQMTQASTEPSVEPSSEVSVEPSPEASVEPSPEASAEPSPEVSTEPSSEVSAEASPDVSTEPSSEASVKPAPEASAEPSSEVSVEPSPDVSTEPSLDTTAEEGADELTAQESLSALQGMGDQVETDESHPSAIDPQNVSISDIAYTCTLSVRCDTILEHLDWLDPDKMELVPSDGVLYATQTVTFYEGESVFNVLLREMKIARIHMEFADTPLYNSAYIEGIGNLYEFDCGETSGWMYQVNGWFPNYGCSRYQLQDGDVIEWVYTCSLGTDVS